MKTLPRIAIIGAGSMGGAIAKALLEPGVDLTEGMAVSANTPTRLHGFAAHPAVNIYVKKQNNDANILAAREAKIIVLAVKPAQISEVIHEIAAEITAETILVSVAAGVNISQMKTAVKRDDVAIFRAMPNIPATVLRGVTGISADQNVSESALKVVSYLFEAIGKVIIIPEVKIDALSTVSGSGPAYVYFFMEKLIAAAQELGFSYEEASLMVKETFLGASELLCSLPDARPEHLRAQVTSPGGTTAQAISVFEKSITKNMCLEALKAAAKRADELSQLNS